jgi:hypothetical protein
MNHEAVLEPLTPSELEPAIDWLEREPAALLRALPAHQGMLLVDLDETLFLRNSTEAFLDGAFPQTLWFLVFKCLDVLKPWRWTGGGATRDVWRVRLALWLSPGLMRRWHARVAALAEAHLNQPLAQALRASGQPVVLATLGFDRIVQPLVAALGFGDVPLVACRVGSLADRRRGKLALVEEALGAQTLHTALVVTDSREDLPLMRACQSGWLVRWPQAAYRAALSRTYLPLRYLMLVKRPGERYIRRGILQEDFAFWVLASITLTDQHVRLVGGLALLLLSFWTLYERGYVDNDDCAVRLERVPKLAPAHAERLVATPRLLPWVWSVAAGAAGLALLNGLTERPLAAAGWMAVLLLTHGLFWIYNRFDKHTRVWLFAGLQWLRAASFAVVVPISLAGGVVLAAHASARWLPYYLYRQVGGHWPPLPVFLVRLLLFALMMVSVTLALGFAEVWDSSAALLLGWNLFRAHAELSAVAGAARRLDGPAP